MTLPHQIRKGDDIEADPVEQNFEALDSTSSTLDTNMITVWHLFDPISGHNHGGGSNSGGIVNHGTPGSASHLSGLSDDDAHPQYISKEASVVILKELEIQPDTPQADNYPMFYITPTPSGANIFEITYGGDVNIRGTDSVINVNTGSFLEDILLGGTSIFSVATPSEVGTIPGDSGSSYALSREDHIHQLAISNSNVTILTFELGGTLVEGGVVGAKSFTVPSVLDGAEILEVQHYIRDYGTGLMTAVYDNGATISGTTFDVDNETYINGSPSITSLISGHLITCDYNSSSANNCDSSITMILKTTHDIN